jgi:hypothetical protein
MDKYDRTMAAKWPSLRGWRGRPLDKERIGASLFL